MSQTGWMGGAPDEAARAMPLTEQLMAIREQGPGDVVATALARSAGAEAREAAERAATAIDPDERAANLINRGLMPGQMSMLHGKRSEVAFDLEDEREKLAKGERVNARVRGMLERGQIGGLAASQMLDGDFGDAHRAEQLELRLTRLDRQIAEASELMVPPEARARNAVEEAASRARRILADVTAQRAADDEAEARGRAQLRAERAAFRTAGGRLPFASRGGAAEEVTCPTCLEMGASGEESFMIHHTDADGRPLAVPEAELAGSEGDAGRSERWPVSYDVSGHEITRGAGYNELGEYGNHVAFR